MRGVGRERRGMKQRGEKSSGERVENRKEREKGKVRKL